jgi:hypothetical protein
VILVLFFYYQWQSKQDKAASAAARAERIAARKLRRKAKKKAARAAREQQLEQQSLQEQWEADGTLLPVYNGFFPAAWITLINSRFYLDFKVDFSSAITLLVMVHLHCIPAAPTPLTVNTLHCMRLHHTPGNEGTAPPKEESVPAPAEGGGMPGSASADPTDEEEDKDWEKL